MGYVYLLESVNDDSTTYKIGYTKNSVKKRIAALQTGNSYNIKEVSSFETQYNQKLERTLHNFYKHKKIKNEWFSLDISEVSNFINTCEKIEKNFDLLKNNPFFKT